jgi:hypothetical protein
MNMRIAFLLRGPDGSVEFNGCEVADRFEVDNLPRVGEHVILPPAMIARLEEKFPADFPIPPKRFVVTALDHHWDSGRISLYVTDVPSVRRISAQQ